MSPLIVLVAREERLDGTGGAVATWVREVQAHHPATAKLLALVNGEGAASTKVLRIVSIAISAIAEALSRFTSWHKGRWERALWLRGFWYVLLLMREIRGAEVLYIHNRPRYAVFARRLGYRGRIILHMHNDPVSYFSGLRIPPAAVADRYVFCSEYARNRAVQQCGVPESRTSVILNGVEGEVPQELSQMGPKLLFVGRLQPLKGPDIAIEVVSLLRERGVPATLTVVGGTEPGLRSERTSFYECLEARVSELNSRHGSGTVSLVGPLPLSKVFDEMRRHPILIAPSRVEEAFGMVLAEAMSCGSVPVAPSRGGIPEVLAIAGYTAANSEADSANLADAVLRVAVTSDDRRREAASRVINRLSWKRIRAEYRALLESLEGRGG